MTDLPPRPLPTTTRTLRSGTGYMVVGTFVGAVAAYLFQLVAGRVLGPEAFAPITVLWTIQFLVFTIVFLPMEQLTIRRLSVDDPDAAPWRLFIAVIVGATAIATGFAALTLDQLLDGERSYLVVVAALITAYGGFALARGLLGGHRRYKEYGLTTMFESVVRLIAAVVLLMIGVDSIGLAWTLVVGALVVWVWKPFAHEFGRGDAGIERGIGADLGTFVAANAAS
ncbi:MAG: hypothetical protein R3246_12840, partial [Acidimicrobiia bacterium]|nr:hypothetical protein [Acidimicrobiia bacterium]